MQAASRKSNGTRILALASGKGGTGKTTLAVNLALALNRRGHSVCLFDADFGLSNAEVHLGLSPQTRTLEGVLFDGLSLDEALIPVRPGLDLLSGSSGVARMTDLDRVARQRLVDTLAALNGYDFIIIDNSPGISAQVVSLCLATREILLVINPEASSLVDAYALLKVLRENGLWWPPLIVVNRAESGTQARHLFRKFQETVINFLGLKPLYLGVVPMDSGARRISAQGQPFVTRRPELPASQAILGIAQIVSERLNKAWAMNDPALFFENVTVRLKQGPDLRRLVDGSRPASAVNDAGSSDTYLELVATLDRAASLSEQLLENPAYEFVRERFGLIKLAMDNFLRPLDRMRNVPPGSRPRVLIVSNHEQMRVMLSEIVLELGYRAAVCKPGQGECLDYRDTTNLLIVSCDRPESLTLAAVEQLPEIPVILLTGFGSSRLETALAPRTVAVFARPFRLGDLREVLQTVLG